MRNYVEPFRPFFLVIYYYSYFFFHPSFLPFFLFFFQPLSNQIKLSLFTLKIPSIFNYHQTYPFRFFSPTPLIDKGTNIFKKKHLLSLTLENKKKGGIKLKTHEFHHLYILLLFSFLLFNFQHNTISI